MTIRRAMNLSLDRLKGHHEIHERPPQDGGDLAIVNPTSIEPRPLAQDESLVAGYLPS
jgi:hypothetical protein